MFIKIISCFPSFLRTFIINQYKRFYYDIDLNDMSIYLLHENIVVTMVVGKVSVIELVDICK